MRVFSSSCSWLVAFIVFVLLGAPASASDLYTATKVLNGDGTHSSTASVSAISIVGSAQTVKWTANRTGGATDGDAFWLFKTSDPGTLNAESISESLPSGASSGTFSLPPGNWRISIDAGAMGTGSYTITWNLANKLDCNPLNFDFGDVLDGANSANHTFSLSNTGDFDVTLTTPVLSDATHYEISSYPSGVLAAGSSSNFQVRYKALAVAGNAPVDHNGTLTAGATGTPAVSSVVIQLQGTSLPKLPDVDCCAGGVDHLGQADHTTGETQDFGFCFENTGSKVLHVTGLTLVNDDPLAPFSAPAFPATPFDVAAGGTRNLTIHFAPTLAGGEHVYAGHVSIQSDDPDEATHSCPFDARAHHPVPIIRIEETLLDYHEVELGFAYTKVFVIHNDGDATLHPNVALRTPPSGDEAQWSQNELTTGAIAPGAASAPQEQAYQPQLVTGPGETHEMGLVVSHDDLTKGPIAITLVGRATAPVPIDAMLVLDRSGSMSEAAGSRQKIEVLGDAVGHFADLLASRHDTVDDKLGYVKYNDANSIYLPLQVLDATQLAAALDHVDAGALGDTARLGPDGDTGIGGAMQNAAGVLASSPADRKHVMVVLTDGKENVDPHVGTVLGPITAADPELSIYSLGLGDDFDGGLLASITNVSPADGYFQAQGPLTGTDFFDLESFYFKIFVDAAGWEIVVDPTLALHLDTPDPQLVDSADIVSSDHSAIFVVYEIPELRPFYDLQVMDPFGHLIDPTSVVGGVPVHVLTRPGYRIVRVVFPDLAHSGDYVGTWSVWLKANGKWDEKKAREALRHYPGYASGSEWISPFAGLVPIGFGTAVASDYRLDVAVGSDSTLPGAHVHLTGVLTDRQMPAAEGHIEVTATTPDGAVHPALALADDGLHDDGAAGDGVFSATFASTAQTGTYRFLFHSIGKNERGELAPREETRYLHLAAPPKTHDPDGGEPGGHGGRGDEPCLPCGLQWLLWILVIVLLLVILLRRR
jgi:hypothetical protein